MIEKDEMIREEKEKIHVEEMNTMRAVLCSAMKQT